MWQRGSATEVSRKCPGSVVAASRLEDAGRRRRDDDEGEDERGGQRLPRRLGDADADGESIACTRKYGREKG